MPEHFEIRIRKEALKFAASHMTVFPDGTKESLHGHQYQPTLILSFKDASFENLVPFSDYKIAMKKIAHLWDEKVLIATENPFFECIRQTEAEIEFKLCGKRYVLPADEVIQLNVDNITCERLAQAYFEFLKAEIPAHLVGDQVISAAVMIEESPGQGATFIHASEK
jgi:6-pyruvoyltetrahydropterin/6-carboxytetrahydropterin synthase